MPMKPTTVVLFGATGDLSRRKLLPGLLHLFQSGLMADIQIIGTSLDEYTTETFIEFVEQSVKEFSDEPIDQNLWSDFTARLHFVPGSAGADGLRKAVLDAELNWAGQGPIRLH